jgi:hypothetical protein
VDAKHPGKRGRLLNQEIPKGLKCRKGHDLSKTGRTKFGDCPQCKNDRQQRRRRLHPEIERGYNKKALKRKMKWEKDNWKKHMESVRRWRASSPTYRKYQRAYNRSPVGRIAASLRARLRDAMRRANTKQADYTISLLGYSARQLKAHLERLFLPGMSWKNYGFKGWHIDHIKPICTFDLATEEGQRAAFHYTNCQPLWARDNLRKGRKYGNT